MGDVILFPLGERRVARNEEPAASVGTALRAAHADQVEESRDRLDTAIALGLLRESGDGPLLDVATIKNR